MTYNTAVMSAQSFKTFNQAKTGKAFWGRLVESACGAYLLNAAKGTSIEVFYWRENNQEVDFVLKKGSQLTALDLFIKKFNPKSVFLVGSKGYP